MMFGFGFNGNGQLSKISNKQKVTLDLNIVAEPLEMLTQKSTTVSKSNSQKPKQENEKSIFKESVTSQIKTLSITWDSILFIYEDGSWMVSGFKSQEKICTKGSHTDMRVISGCLMWDSIVLVDDLGKSFTSHPASGQDFLEVGFNQTEALVKFDGAQGISRVVSGGKHCFALTDSQRVAHLEKQGTTGSYMLRPLSLQVAIKELCCGKEHTILLSRIGAVFTFGLGGQGQLGHGDIESCEEPTIVEALQGVTIATIAAGGWHSVAVSDIGDIYIWGWNERGQLGFPSKTIEKRSENPLPTAPPGDQLENSEQIEYINILAQPTILDVEIGSEVNISKVSCGSRHTAAVTESGDLYTWGWNKYGQLGHSDINDRDKPSRVEFFRDRNLTVGNVHCGYWNTIVTLSDDTS